MFSPSRFNSLAVSTAISLASLPILPSSMWFKCSWISSALGILGFEEDSSSVPSVSFFSNKSCILFNVSCNLSLKSASLILSSNFAVSPNASLFSTVLIIENKMSWRYFQMVSLVFAVISNFQRVLKWTCGKNSVSNTESSSNISGFWYKISKKRGGNFFWQKVNKNSTVVLRCSEMVWFLSSTSSI